MAVAVLSKQEMDERVRAARKACGVPEVDASDLPELKPEDVPIDCAYWNILVAPVQARSTTEGGIVVAAQTKNTEQYLITIGRVLKCGPSAFEGKTESGIELNKLCKGIERPEDLIGKFVIFQPHAGIEVKRRADERKVRFISNTEILGITSDPDAFRFWL